MSGSAEEILQTVLEARGYVIFQSPAHDEYRIGEVVAGGQGPDVGDTDAPMVVLGETTREDFKAQVDFIGFPWDDAQTIGHRFWRARAE